MQNNIFIKYSRRRTLAIKIDCTGKVIVYCPLNTSKKRILELLNDKKQWIVSHLEKINTQNSKSKQFFEYQKISILGNIYDVMYKDNKIVIGETSLSTRCKNNVQTIKKWLVKQAREIVLTRLKHWSNVMKIAFNRGELTSARKKWGSCDNKHNIRLNFRLIMLPYSCIDYVCIHELSHILQMNHSKKFWEYVSKYVPNYKDIKKILKDYSYTLQLF